MVIESHDGTDEVAYRICCASLPARIYLSMQSACDPLRHLFCDMVVVILTNDGGQSRALHAHLYLFP